MPARLKVRIEQTRQARSIHGSLFNMCVAALGVRLARLPLPSRHLREHLYRTVYGKKYTSLNESELEQPLSDYRSLNELFTRGVRPECRPLPEEEDAYLVPCDSTVQEIGQIDNDTILTAKGIDYSLESLLPTVDTSRLTDGEFAIFFLSPADCHRVFSPHQASLDAVVHVPGSRLLVHPPFQRAEFPVFSLNERVIHELSTPLGQCVLVMVAGWGVGNISHPHAFHLPQKRRGVSRIDLERPIELQRGDWLATFELGSTVILLTKSDKNLSTGLRAGDTVRCRQVAYVGGPSPHPPAEAEI